MKHWIEAMRLRTLPLALSSVLAGSALVGHKNASFGVIVGLAVLTTVLLQILSNLANDYGDSQNGADNDGRIGPKRAVQAGIISPKSMFRAIIINAILAFLSGLALLWVSFGKGGHWLWLTGFLLLGLGAIAAAVKYTAGKNPYGYRGLGDLFVLLFFGLVGVAGTYVLHVGELSGAVFLPALAIGAFSTAVLNLNNLRDHQNDASAGKRTLVVIFGYSRARYYHLSLFVIAWSSLVAYLLWLAPSVWMALILVFLPLHVVHIKHVFSTTEPAKLDPELKKIALTTFGLAFILFVVSLLK